MVLCPQCKRTLDPDSRFCKHCGANLAVSTTIPSPPTEHSAPSISKQVDVYRDPQGERPVWQGRPSWRAFYGTWGLWLSLSIVGLVLAHRYAGAQTAWVTFVWLLVLGAAATLVARQMLLIYGHRFRMTTQRLFIHRGILTRVTDQVELFRINDVRMRQGLIDRLVNTGDLEILGTDETDDDIFLRSISNPQDVAESLRLHVRAARSKGTLAVESI